MLKICGREENVWAENKLVLMRNLVPRVSPRSLYEAVRWETLGTRLVDAMSLATNTIVYLPREVISSCSHSKDVHRSSNVAPCKTQQLFNKLVDLTSRSHIFNTPRLTTTTTTKMHVLTCLWLFSRRKATMLVLITAQQFTASVIVKSRLYTMTVIIMKLVLGFSGQLFFPLE